MTDGKTESKICREYEILQERAKDITGENFSIFNNEFAFNFVGSNGLTVLEDLNEVGAFLRGYKKAKELLGKTEPNAQKE